ncbi:FecR family protein [Pedobacter frigoris]|uniref:DUF4974 domain-containing protein n=1 Tax=Pedobacter frigoris TaxID=2571272 RepID=A0A4U1CH43_9SPHI|nr:FecR family protein [Pedobacter frigoris]TKC06074.1 DUF4974 domain-containing protein [Pedobacter frigoris]
MKKSTLKELLIKRRDGTITSEERLLLETWYNHYADQAVPFENTSRYLTDMQALDQAFATKEKSKSVKLWPRLVAAAVIILIAGAGLFYYDLKTKEINNQVVVTNDIPPGALSATLTLASGKKIRLSDEANVELANEAGISISKTADGQLIYELKEGAGSSDKINTLSTEKGETYILTLPDKSKVWLNAASKLTYSASLLKNGKRSIKLEGEAYFEIAKDRAHPFVVESKGQEVEVLGTHFNINSYSDEGATKTTLLEGSVRVSSPAKRASRTGGNTDKVTLKPGQQASNNGTALQVGEADIESVTDWKNGDFFLNRVDFRTAMRKIARWYDVELIYDSSIPDDIQSSGYISRGKKLSSVLKLIERSGQVKFRVQGRKVYIYK